MTQSYLKLQRILEEKGIAFTIHEHEPSVSVQDALEKLPFPFEQFLKTVVFQLKGSGDYVLVALRGKDVVDYRKLAQALEAKREMLIRPNPTQIEQDLGFEMGGVSPIALQQGVRVIVDYQAATTLATVYCGAGRSDRTLEVEVSDLIAISKALVAPVVQS